MAARRASARERHALPYRSSRGASSASRSRARHARTRTPLRRASRTHRAVCVRRVTLSHSVRSAQIEMTLNVAVGTHAVAELTATAAVHGMAMLTEPVGPCPFVSAAWASNHSVYTTC